MINAQQQPSQRLVNINNPKGIQTIEELQVVISRSAAAVRQAMTMAYGLAHYTCLDAIDHVRQLPQYKHQVKQAYKHAIDLHHIWEHNLLYNERQRFFAVKDLTSETRARYKEDLTNREYFQMWLDIGAYAYDKYRPMVLSLRYKYEKSLKEHGQQTPELFSWAIIGCVALEMAQDTYNELINNLYKCHGIPREDLMGMFRLFSLQAQYDAWMHATRLLFPYVEHYEIEGEDKRNITMGLDDLYHAYSSQYLSYDTELEVLEDNAELYRTKGFHKKQMREASDAAAQFNSDIAEAQLKEHIEKMKKANDTET